MEETAGSQIRDASQTYIVIMEKWALKDVFNTF
jgi:hypothetical protein